MIGPLSDSGRRQPRGAGVLGGCLLLDRPQPFACIGPHFSWVDSHALVLISGSTYARDSFLC